MNAVDLNLPNKELLTIHEVMDVLSLQSRKTVYNYIDQGRLEAVRFSRSTRITRRSLLQFLR